MLSHTFRTDFTFRTKLTFHRNFKRASFGAFVAIPVGLFLLVGCVVESPPPENDELDAINLSLSGDELRETFAGERDEDGFRVGPWFESQTSFNRIGLMFDLQTLDLQNASDLDEGTQPTAQPAFSIEVRSADNEGNLLDAWREVPVSWSEGDAYNAALDLDHAAGSAKARRVQVRLLGAGDRLVFLRLVALTYAGSTGLEIADESSTEQGLAAESINVVSRSTWGARNVNCGGAHTPNRITIHHTETPTRLNGTVAGRLRQIQAFHIDTRGWCDIGYHLLIGDDGLVYQGRREDRIGAHAGPGNNTNNVGLSFIGNFMNVLPNEPQREAGAAAIAAVAQDWDIALSRSTVKGHREMRATDCPGDTLYDYLQSLVDLAGGADLPPPPPPSLSGCTSQTLGANVDHGACVQVTYSACGADTCSWFRCQNGSWQCTALSACPDQAYAQASCEVPGGDDGDGDDGDGGGNGGQGFSGSCEMRTQNLEMYWSSCASSMDGCFSSGGARYVALPATGPVVKEAHLVTVTDGFGTTWPSSSRDTLNQHYAASEQSSGYPMSRTEDWAPAGEGGSEWGQGSTGAKVPVLDEAWYITMYWRNRPAGGTRMIVTNPANGRSVVAAAGWETGPGATTSLAGVSEEIHDYLGTGHLSTLTVGFAVDESLPLGPILCGDGNLPEPDVNEPDVNEPDVNEPDVNEPDVNEPDVNEPDLDDPNSTASYSDLPSNHPAFAAAEALRAQGALWGCAPGSFCPDAPLRRDSLANILAVLETSAVSLPASPVFSDVGTSHWAYAHVQELRAREITYGCGAGKYCPGNDVSRASFAVYLRRAQGLSGIPGTPASDVAGSHWAAASIGAILEAGLMDACSGGGFCPETPVTRAEAAIFATRAYE